MPRTNRFIARGIYQAIVERKWFADLPSLETEQLQAADRIVLMQCDKCDPPLANKMLRAILSKKELVAIELVKKLRESEVLKLSLEPIYYGWALTRLGRVDEARVWFLKLRAFHAENRFLLRAPKIASDAEMVRIAYAGDIFHWF